MTLPKLVWVILWTQIYARESAELTALQVRQQLGVQVWDSQSAATNSSELAWQLALNLVAT